MSAALTKKRLAEAAGLLAVRDKDLARILRDDGTPPLWGRKPGFVTLIRIILEQQVSLASADAAYRRLTDNLAPLTPDEVLAAGVTSLRSLGITRQKATYCANVADAIRSGELDLKDVGRSDDETAIGKLTQIKGVGPWTAQIYLLMALRRPDVWPAGDIALAAAVQSVKGLQERPTPAELAEAADAWRPYRAAAARMLWQHYLNSMSKRESNTRRP
ncbi:MAG: DNA-3-methyladenine glycosylase 2 family protein [Kiritimatiellae bacterium]|nr:DNA-3-methyladenine glycosylase 2 family protein [Kiritimatiellia bacterium]